jgi:precorrin-4/cobalt-precorrin-4 C11-methyltransferase
MVKIVGAGPGAKDLITVRGMRMLNEADVIIYAGSLVNEELLEYAKKDCEIYNSAYMNLREVIDVIVKAEGEGKNIVRLHTGDPSLYGAIREQIEELAKYGITCEICPTICDISNLFILYFLNYFSQY